METRIDSYKIGGSFSRLENRTHEAGYFYVSGDVVTKHGIVSVIQWAQGSKRMEYILRLDMVYNGTLVVETRFPLKPHTNRGIAIIAGRFANDVADVAFAKGGHR